MTQRQILFYMHQQPIVPDPGTQYKENPANHYGRMCEDRRTALSYIPQFDLGGTGNNRCFKTNWETFKDEFTWKTTTADKRDKSFIVSMFFFLHPFIIEVHEGNWYMKATDQSHIFFPFFRFTHLEN